MVTDMTHLGEEARAKLERIARKLGVEPEELAADLAEQELLRRTASRTVKHGVVTPFRRR